MQLTTNTSLIEERKRCQWSQQEVAERIGTTQHNVSRWERGVTAPGPYFRAKLCTLFGKRAEELGLIKVDSMPLTTVRETSSITHTDIPQTSEFTLWTVPYSRNPYFTGRDELLELLEQHLSPEEQCDLTTTRQSTLTQPLALKGLGGIGKSQIAIEYAYRAREQNRYTYTLWINAVRKDDHDELYDAHGIVPSLYCQRQNEPTQTCSHNQILVGAVPAALVAGL